MESRKKNARSGEATKRRSDEATKRRSALALRRIYLAEALESRVLLTTSITAATLDYNHAPNAFKLDLSSPLSSPLTANQVTLDNLTTDTQIAAGKLTVTTSTDGLHVSIGVHNLVDSNGDPLSTVGRADVLPNGWFKLSISKFDVPSLAADFSYQDFYLIADTANPGELRDGHIDANDYSRIDSGYTQQNNPGAIIDFDHGDFDYNGHIDASDYSRIDSAYTTSLHNPTTPLPPTTIQVQRVPQMFQAIGEPTAYTQDIALSWNANQVSGETGWRIERSTDGQTFSTYWNVNDTAHLTGSNVTVTDPTVQDLPQGQWVYYRIRAYGGGVDTSYTPKQRVETYLPPPTMNATSTYVMEGDHATVSFTDRSDAESGFTLKVFKVQPPPEETGGEEGEDIPVDFTPPTPEQTIAVPAHAGTGTVNVDVSNLSAWTDYYFTIGATSQLNTPTGNSPSATVSSNGLDPTSAWTDIYSNPDGNSAHGFWSQEAPNGEYGNFTSDHPLTLTVTGLPRHTYVSWYFRFGYSFTSPSASISVLVDGGGGTYSSTTHTGSFYIGSDHEPGVGAIAHNKGTLTFKFVATGFDNGGHWSPDIAWARSYIPFISVSGGGWTKEGDTSTGGGSTGSGGSGTIDPPTVPEGASFTLTREGTQGFLDNSVDVKWTKSGTAEASEYSGIPDAPSIPAGQESAKFDLTATDDQTPEWSESVIASLLANQNYVVVAGSSTKTATITDNDLSISIDKTTLIAGQARAKLTLKVPQGVSNGAMVALDAPEQKVRIFSAPTGGTDFTDFTWTYGVNGRPPENLWVEVIHGSGEENDIRFNLIDLDSPLQPMSLFTANSVETEATAMRLKIVTEAGLGSDITEQSQRVMIGTYNNLSAILEAPINWVATATYSWSIPGSILRDFIANQNNGYTLALGPNDTISGAEDTRVGTSTKNAPFFWTSTSGAGPDAQVVTVTASVNGHTISAKTTFNVYSPTVSIVKDVLGTSDVHYPNEHKNQTQLGLGPTGIDWIASVRVPQGFEEGTWSIVQVIDSTYRFRIKNLPGASLQSHPNNGLSGIDNGYPYPFNGNNGNPFSTGVGNHEIVDSPGFLEPTRGPWLAKYYEAEDAFSTWIMFTPSGGKAVPLRVEHWGWRGKFDLDAAAGGPFWFSQGGACTQWASGLSPTNVYPEWNGRVPNLNFP